MTKRYILSLVAVVFLASIISSTAFAQQTNNPQPTSMEQTQTPLEEKKIEVGVTLVNRTSGEMTPFQGPPDKIIQKVSDYLNSTDLNATSKDSLIQPFTDFVNNAKDVSATTLNNTSITPPLMRIEISTEELIIIAIIVLLI